MPRRILSVSELNNYIKTIIDSNSILRRVSVEGEISNMTRASSGHYYFSLKDQNSEIRCIMWRSTATQLKFNPADGMNVKVNGAVQVYSQRGTYSIILTSMQPAGIGTLYQIFTDRVKKLESKGFFNKELKKEIPENIKRVGVVTSETGAVIHDIITTIKRRNPLIEILLVPAVVQGEGAKESVAKGIKKLNEMEDIDVIIVGRGGGSLEDLWAFNEEEVANAIFNSKKPVISSVGHETDVTISDLVADLRAPTPTAAAEFVSNDFADLVNILVNLDSKVTELIVNKYNNMVQEVNRFENRIQYLNPENKITSLQFKVDELDLKLNNSIKNKLNWYTNKLENLELQIKLLNPTYLLEKGYAMVTDKQEQIITTKAQADKKEELIIHFHDGNVLTKVDHKNG